MPETPTWLKAFNRLGWLNSRTRQILLLRFWLRLIPSLGLWERGGPGLNALDLISLLMQLTVRTLGGPDSNSNNVRAPFRPNDRPTEFSITVLNSPLRLTLRNHKGDLLTASIRGQVYSIDSSLEEGIAKNSLHALLTEIDQVGKGINLTRKHLADQRSEELLRTPLWGEITSAQVVFPPANVELSVNASPGAYDAFRAIYAALLEGRQIDKQYIGALSDIRDSIWYSHSRLLFSEIKKIPSEFLSAAAPLAEKIQLSSESGLFEAIPIAVENRPFISVLTARVDDALIDAVRGGNGLTPESREFRVLKRCIQRYGNDPQRLEMDFTSVAIGLRRQIQQTLELASSEDNLALLEAIEEAALGIRAAHSEVAANRIQLARQSFSQLSPSDRQELGQALPVLQAISADGLREDFTEDVPLLIKDSIVTPESIDPSLLRIDPIARVFGRSSRIAIIWHSLVDRGAELHDGKGHKAMRLGLTYAGVASALSTIVAIGLRLFGIL
jgi:hypothetical protein